MNVPFIDLKIQHKKIYKELKTALDQVLERGDFILGKDVGLLEQEFAKFCGTKYSLGVSSGTAALFLALDSLNIKEGDEVIVPTFTFIATALAVSYTKATPVFVDIDENSYNIDVNRITGAITSRTKAIIPVHLYGQPANMPEIIRIAKRHSLKIIEDACQAHGAQLKMPDGKWHQVGSIGDIGAFSFYPSKNLGGLGDGGMITTSNEEMHKKLAILRDCGRVSKYEHELIGYNSRLDTFQAAALRVKLKKISAWNALRIEAACVYNNLLKEVHQVTTPKTSLQTKHVYHVYAVRCLKRDLLLNFLREKGIGVLTHYNIPLHLQKAYKILGYKPGDLPVAEKISHEIISLPMFPFITKKQIKYVVDSIKEFYKNHG